MFLVALASGLTQWNALGATLKSATRSWFVDRAIRRGVPWDELRELHPQDVCAARIDEVRDPRTVTPEYYLRPFHGYADGNLNWEAARELEAAQRRGGEDVVAAEQQQGVHRL